VENSNLRESLNGKLLIATPYLNGSIFEKVLIFICADDEEGSLGIIINKPESSITDIELCRLLKLKRNIRMQRKFQINYGGPVQDKKFFVLSATTEQKRTFDSSKTLTLYTNAEGFLADILKNKNKSDFILVKGFCGWGEGQLDEEIAENSWLVADCDFETLFSKHSSRSWERMVKKLGINDFDKIVGYTGTA